MPGYRQRVADVSLSFAGVQLLPLRCGALFWPAEEALLVADLHLEKGSAYARSGWMLPPYDSMETLRRLGAAIEQTGASRVFALGDSFHDGNGAARLSTTARERLFHIMHGCAFHWITGNHDGDSGAIFGGLAFEEVQLGGIMLRHEASPFDKCPEISGHFHPKVVVPLRTGRRVSRRCFAVTSNKLVLPAYGSYAGGLAVDDPAFRQALGEVPDAIVCTSGGLLHVPARVGPARLEIVG